MTPELPQSIDHLPRPGLAVPLARWTELLAIEQDHAKLREAITRIRLARLAGDETKLDAAIDAAGEI